MIRLELMFRSIACVATLDAGMGDGKPAHKPINSPEANNPEKKTEVVKTFMVRELARMLESWIGG